MQWNSATEFFAMGGYALYVWGGFGACALLMAVEPWLVKRRMREAILNLQRLGRAENLDNKNR
ncbi:MAG: heme exporter protein CcmD [Rhodocyclaceae bacterium]|nr:heme exporter protein CcmD [Rhodocyclaceae bacterium]MBK9624373.1 heme exporter protein CcmD [Rhodocyclaceae bacterium]MBL0074879.1 heme exporter protein CcmD [Rhodocyclaceae bacterium]MBP6109325.1 heme exporter protein CcmD [Rhodocyclaceae bacterium]MBP6278494.1 heme exporter protein CcmD [Rhodocyclaceae bacterium]